MTHAAEIIFNQIKAIDPYAMFDWGTAHQPKVKMTKDGMETLRMKSSGMVAWKGFIDIMYDRGSDSYTIEFEKVRAGKSKVYKRVENVYVDMMVNVIDDVVVKGNM